MAEYPASKSRQLQKHRQRVRDNQTGTSARNEVFLDRSSRAVAPTPLVTTADKSNINKNNNLPLLQPRSNSNSVNSQQQPTSNNPIRHSGRALVRGKFRRVWRPRQLEVLGNGVVKYYELDATPSATTTPVGATLDAFLEVTSGAVSNTTTTTGGVGSHDTVYGEDSPHYPNKPPAKATLWIHHARIIDVTTLRDMHVGLPRGAFGFLFHAHPHATDEDDDYDDYDYPQQHHDNTMTYNNNNNNIDDNYHDNNTNDNDGNNINTGEDGTRTRMTVDTAPYTTSSSAITLMDDPYSNIDLLRVLPMGMVGHGACQGSAQVATSRDFLCAVSSLEEAQSWVIALQWAASMGRESSFQMNPTGSRMMGPRGGSGPSRTLPGTSYASIGNNNSDDDDDDDDTGISRVESWQDDVLSIISSASLSPSRPSKASTKPKSSLVTTSPTNTVKTGTSPETVVSSKPPPSTGKMVVTKVVGYQLVRLEMTQWEIAVQIQVLLVMPTQQQQQQQQQVEEWSILRTASDVQNLLASFQKKDTKHTIKTSNNTKLISRLEQQMERIRKLPCLMTPSSLSKENLNRSVSTVDGMMRFVCMEATLVNSSAMKEFLGLQTTVPPPTTTTNKTNFWTYHQPSTLATPRKRTILLHQSIDQFVREWLQKYLKQQKARQSLAWHFQLLGWYLRFPQPSTTYAGMTLLSLWLSSSLLPSWNRFVRKYQVIPFVSVRLDALIVSWLVAVVLGYWRGSSARNARHGLLSASRTRRHYGIVTSKPMESGTSPTKASNSVGSSSGISKGQRFEKSLQNKSLMDLDTEVDGESSDHVIEEGGGGAEEEDEDGEEHIDMDTEALPSTNSFVLQTQDSRLSSPLPEYDISRNIKESCWSKPKDNIFNVRGPTYLTDRIKIPSAKASFTCQGVDMWITDNPERHIARHPSVLGGRFATMKDDMFLVNFLLPFGNFVSYFSIPPLDQFATPQLAEVWTRFIEGDQQYRDARLKLLPVVVDGPWIVRAAVPGTSPALLGKAIPLQYFFTKKEGGRSIYEVDVIITASSIAKGILSVVKGHAKALSISFAFIIEAACEKELPETVLASVQMNALHLEDCPLLPECNLDAF